MTAGFNCIERFELAVQKYEHLPCIEEGETVVTYGQFYALVEQAAGYILDSGKGKKVAIDLPQGIYAYSLIAGVISAGGSWCPIPRNIPAERKKEIIEAFQPDLVISEPVQTLPGKHRISGAGLPDDAEAYVLFTSGTTGIPKGVTVHRKTIDVFLEWSLETYRPSTSDRWGQFCRLNFDLSVIDLFTSICSGACLVVLNDMQSQVRPLQAINNHRLTIWHSVPSLVDYMIAGEAVYPVDISTLRLASFAGEPLQKYQLDFLFGKNQELKVINSYGTTEGGLNATWLELNNKNYAGFSAHNISIGNAIPGWGVMMENDGELVIYGDYIAKGYVNTSNEKFGSVYVNGSTYPAFFTGDIAYEQHNALYFSGRKDNQVKIRGNRVELNEIEFRITAITGKPCVTILHNGVLHAFVETTEPIEMAGLRKKLSKEVENFKIPASITALAAFPRNTNFKIVRSELAGLIPGNITPVNL